MSKLTPCPKCGAHVRESAMADHWLIAMHAHYNLPARAIIVHK